MRRSLALVPLLLASALTVGEAEAHGGIRATSPGPVDVVAGSTVTITAPTARLSSDCSNSQNGLDPSLRGVRYAWDIDDDGTYDVPASTSRDLDYSAALVPGPSDVPMRLQVSCWYLDSNRPQLDTDDTQFLVRVANAPPVIDEVVIVGGAAGDLTLGATYTFQVVASDAEPADSLAYAWQWSDGQQGSGEVLSRAFWTAGPVTLTVAVSDGVDADVVQMQYLVVDPAPVITGVEYPTAIAEGELASLVVRASDTSAQLSAWWVLPMGVELPATELPGSTPGAWSAELEWTPPGDGVWPIEVFVTDGVSVVSEQRWLGVSNAAPQIKAVSAETSPVWEGQPVELVAEGADPGGDPIEAAWALAGAFGPFGAPGDLRATWIPEDDAAEAPIGVTLRDDQQASTTAWQSFVVLNRPPEIEAFEVTADVAEGEPATARIVATDVPADPLSITWTVDGALAGEGDHVELALPVGTHRVHVRVDDGDQGVVERDQDVTVHNADPVGRLDLPSDPLEGVEYALSVDASDAGGGAVGVSWSFGDGAVGAGPEVAHTWADDGRYQVRCQLADASGGVTVIEAEVVVGNVEPEILEILAPEVAEGHDVSLDAVVHDQGADLVQVSWWVAGRQVASGPTWRARFPDDARVEVRVVADDGDGGRDELVRTFDVHNVPPSVEVMVASGGPTVTFTAQVTDPGDDTFTYAWSFGDGQTAVGGSTVQHTYASNGHFEVSVQVEDDDHGVGVGTATAIVEGIGPEIAGFSLPPSVDEGTAAQLGCLARDAGQTGVLDYRWDFGDGGVGSGSIVTHAWPDNGDWYVSCRVVDGQRAEAVVGGVLHVENVAPVVSGQAPRRVVEGDVATFAPALSDPGLGDTHTWSFTGPSAASIDPVTGVLRWETRAGDAGRWEFVVTARDDDGATGSLTFTLEVAIRDVDGDGIADGWEVQHGLDPNNPSDAHTDRDMDGRTAFDEYTAGSDPNVSDVPGRPALLWPVDGEAVEVAAPELVVGPPTGETDALRYDLRVYADPSMAVRVDGVDGVGGDPAGVRWAPAPLVENQVYWWTARASDDWATGMFADLRSFVVNATQEAPGPVTLLGPTDGSTVAELSPTLTWTASVDPDGDAVAYRLVIDVFSPAQATRIVNVPGGASPVVAWQVTPPLADRDEVCWRVLPSDETGMAGPVSEGWCFVVDTSNLPPDAPEILAPVDGETILADATTVDVRNAVDPEGREVRLRFELSTDPSFAEAAVAVVASDLSGITSWPTGPLQEDSWYFVRVAGTDGAAQGPWATASFFVNVHNDPPNVPVPVLPEPGDVLLAGGELAVASPVDPEGFDVTVDFIVWSGGVIVAQATAVPVAGDRTAWAPGLLPSGSYTWQARATDAQGASSDWSDARSFLVPSVGPGPNSRQVVPPDIDVEPLLLGCGCQTHGAGGAGAWAVLLVLPWLRRRR